MHTGLFGTVKELTEGNSAADLELLEEKDLWTKVGLAECSLIDGNA
jgi:hypothetical protein